ncbi:hypothetical protein ACH5RR_032739 [Cinchona calisaya]|uniref:F-box protein n=1 Tax=Cinchona calisaya TaxID=153742 RepID=A0ABD2YIY8_9GENT
MDLWVMKDYGVVESWTKVASLPPDQMLLCISGKGEILLSCASDFGLYNLGDQSLTHHKIEDVDEVYHDDIIYVESLVSPVANDDAEGLCEQRMVTRNFGHHTEL